MAHQQTEVVSPHVLIFPCPAQGHITSMLNLAELLCLAGLHVTFLVTDNHHRLLLRHGNVQSRFGCYPGFRFETISDGLPEDDPLRSAEKIVEFYYLFVATAKSQFRELLVSNRQCSNKDKRITCIVADSALSLTLDVAEEVGIPTIVYRTSSTSDFWAFFCAPKLIEAGELPFKGKNLDLPIEGISGMDGILRRRDLPSFFRAEDLADQNFQGLLFGTLQTSRAQGLIFNTFEELDGPVLEQARLQCPKIYAIGPLHAHLKIRLTTHHDVSSSNGSLWEEDKSCMKWLDSQPSSSVIYVSFGSLATVSKHQLVEFWHGLINSGKKFLWVVRRDLLVGNDGDNQIPAQVLNGTRERGYLVQWAPQEEVLAHQAIGGFLTHSGWNSTLESIIEGVPMICWPYLADQHINSRFVEQVWKIGLDMKDSCDRVIIEKMVRDLMDVRREEFMKSANRMAKLAKEAISVGGSSYCNLDSLIGDIKLMSV